MAESTAWAIATQQAHKAGKSPKGYGTSEGRSEAKAKYTKPKSQYTMTANPSSSKDDEKTKTASAVDGYSLAMFAAFSDEMQKVAGPVGEALKSFGNLVAGGAKKDLTHNLPQGKLSKLVGMKPKQVSIPGAGPRVGSGLEALKNPATRQEAGKVLAARGAAIGGAGMLGAEVSKAHHEREQDRLGRAYMAGAQDAYSR